MPYVGRDLQRGNYLKLDDISSSFNGSTTTFNLTSGGNAFFPGSAFSIIVSLGGVIQEPESAFQIDRSQIIFAQAPSPNDDFFCIVQGVALGVGVPGHNTVNNDQLAKPLSYGDYFRWDSANNRVGINTLLPSTALDVVGSATFSGNVSIGGTLTYEDVANIDAVGIVTARAGIEDKTLTTGHVVFTGTGGRLIGESQLFYDTSNNFLGIGTNIFGRALTIRHAEPRIRLVDDDTGSFSEVYTDNTGHLYLNADAGGNNGGSRILFHTDGNEKVRIRNDGYIGINTTSPSKLITIKADAPFVRLEAMDGSDKRLDFEVTNVGIATISATQSSQQLSFKTTSGEAIRIKSDLKVGINVSDPDSILETVSPATDGINAHIGGLYNNGGQTAVRRIEFGVKNYRNAIQSQQGSGGDNFTSDNDLILNPSGGKIGIGSDEPADQLDVAGNSIFGTKSTADAQVQIGRRYSGNRHAYLDFVGDDTYYDYGLRIIRKNTGADAESSITHRGTGNLKITTNEASPIVFQTQNIERVQIGSTGISTFTEDVRIVKSGGPLLELSTNTGSADATLRLSEGTPGSTTNGGGMFYSGADNKLHITCGTDSTTKRITILRDDGKVGIASAIPTSPLEIYSAASAAWKFRINTSVSDGAGFYQRTNGDFELVLRDASNNNNYIAGTGGELQFVIDSSEKLRVVGTGISVTGEVAASQDYPNYKPRLNFNFTASKKLDPIFTYQRTGPASFTDEFGKVVLVGSNTPRFDHDPITGECKGLMFEISRTNYVRQSLTLADEWAAGSGDFAIDNTITNPDGSVGAYYHTGSELYHQDIDLSGASTNVITVSLWVKERSGQSGNLDIEIFQQISGSAISLGVVNFNPATATIGTSDANFSDGKVVEYPNGWYRVSAKVTTDSGNFSSSTRYDMQGAEHYVWGMQIEGAAFPTSFIPTNGSISTRGHENVVIDGDDFTDFYNPKESTAVCEFDTSNWITYNANAYERIFSFGNLNTETDTFEVFKQNSSNSNARYRVRTGNSNVLGAADYSYGTNTTPKVAFAVKLNDAALSIDGGTPGGTSDTGIPMPTVTQLSFGNSGLQNNNGVHMLNGYIRKFMYYPVKLSDSQVVTLTS